MGCDGGSIPRRDEMVKLKKKAEKAERDVELMAKWRHCALSGEPLKQPVVGCYLGRMYNKESLILALLDKANLPEVASHIQSLKDTVELKLVPNPSYQQSIKADSYTDVQAAEFVCPVSGLEMSGRYRFVFLTCGCVISEKALKEAPSPTCHNCGSSFSAGDVVVIYGTEEDMKRQRERAEAKKKEAKLAKKRKVKRTPQLPASLPDPDKSACSSTASTALEEVPQGSEADVNNDTALPPPAKRAKLNSQQPPSVNDATKKKHVAKQQATSGEKAKSSTLNGSTAVSMVAKRTAKAIASSYKTVAQDPTARDAYKSLFNSGSKERPRDQSAHWVTFFPYH